MYVNIDFLMNTVIKFTYFAVCLLCSMVFQKIYIYNIYIYIYIVFYKYLFVKGLT